MFAYKGTGVSLRGNRHVPMKCLKIEVSKCPASSCDRHHVKGDLTADWLNHGFNGTGCRNIKSLLPIKGHSSGF